MLKFRDRSIVLELRLLNEEATEYAALMEAVDCNETLRQYIARKSNEFDPVYEYYDEEFGQTLEVPVDCKTLPSKVLSLRFCPIVSPVKVLKIICYKY